MSSYVQRHGNQMLVYINDNTYYAYPTGLDMWIIDLTTGPPDPGTGTGTFSWPFNPATTVTSEYGPRSGGAGTFHEGIDFGKGNAVRGANIYCSSDGVISGATTNSGYGPYITVFHGTIDGHDIYTRYGHLDSYTRWTVGQTIHKGNLVGLESDGGVSTGANLHMETHLCAIGGSIINDLTDHTGSTRTAINPRSFFATYGDGGILNP